MRFVPDYRIVKKRPVQREEAEQVSFAMWMAQCFPDLKWHHSPNGGLRSRIAGAKLRAAGTSPGFPDIIIFGPTNVTGKVGVAIELKAPKPHKSAVSRDQRGWLAHLDACGFLTFIAYGVAEATAIVEEYYGSKELAA